MDKPDRRKTQNDADGTIHEAEKQYRAHVAALLETCISG
jgi:hypothetical protein